ncbi:hypothetical protein TraAM80_01938 [Trypanosoma rangeli]|uniref:Uncharacterized protein n=1 Tax=Trypanosoma rangeli TaxID=5698 RepID=A0A3R7MQV9_TRYRA|nr:uncharacterized protein TraAM80_01938 [Trypanosoma rangeli]RNF09804.1 hypothetical protein TraAM80_01938 [Trypanosoma rangeli]|eukprot:RNF09804.1 hypothetical protein TraAM80_01938 [Trypanosoma rangeli]
MAKLFAPFQTEASDALRVPPTASLAVSNVKKYSSYIPDSRIRVREIVVRLQRRLRFSLRAHKRLLLGMCGTVVVVYALQKAGRVCGARHFPQSAQRTESKPAFGQGNWRVWDFLSAWVQGALNSPLGTSTFHQVGEDDDDVNFVDASESAFRMFQRRVERTHEAPLLRALSELESLGERWKSHALQLSAAGKEKHEGEGTVGAASSGLLQETSKEALRELVLEKAIEADELLTQYVVQLDMAPVGDSIDLRKERKESIVAASALAKRIEVWTHLPPHQQQ